MGKARIYSIQIPILKRCTFCRNWDDPANTNIKLVGAQLWEYEITTKKRCKIMNGFWQATSRCKNFESKI